ncbi:TetR family transcriptional regulator C-terminal domain-containing protein [Methylovirgula sp. 4M-Z18]|uniref:TetR family transcriptional regulator C-terminal domain-containing protein n=1 Tax=Methylovirgula sp. 4M-Z18 TaxID=2293567 RepID=UPI000E2E496A|nr:TetR family transcriptional regulator C-terminal domain-containing protein [Methylovirgula sp. 4M-Z18]RFB78758.1 TetR family transcriptional regulator [Methylovirgula sp. 4M-Z18]
MGIKVEKEADSVKGAIRTENERLILSAAEQVFAEMGFKGATTAEIARRAKVPKANLHYYFSTKEDLYRILMERLIAIWMNAASTLDETDDPVAALSGYIGAKMDLARQYPYGSKIFASEIMRGAPLIQGYIENTMIPWLDHHSVVIRGWIAEGKLRPIEPKYLFFMIWAATQHYADFSVQIELLNDGRALSDKQFAMAKAQVITTIMNGVLPDGKA